MKRFSEKCHNCLCPGYTLNDKCKCGCHEGLKEMMAKTGLNFEECIEKIKMIKNEIENNPIGEMALSYDFFKIRTGRYINDETVKER